MHPSPDAIVPPMVSCVGWAKAQNLYSPQIHLRARLCPRDYPGEQNSLVLHDDRVGNGERRRPPYDCC